MSSNARKREKHRLKREKKKRDMRRMESVSPFRRAAHSTAPQRAYVTAGWRESGMADFLVVGQLPGGMLTMAQFLVDLWCVGLKDAWGRSQLSHDQLAEGVLTPWRERVGEVETVDIDTVRKYVGGGIRFSRKNGFRLPEHWERYTAILGDIGPIESADLSGFGIDGGLRYVGDFEFLRRRLVGCTVEQFLNRPDVRYITSADSYAEHADVDEDDSENEFEDDPEVEAIANDPGVREHFLEPARIISSKIAAATRRWCIANNVAAARRLDDGALLFFYCATKLQNLDEDLPAVEQDRRVLERMEGEIDGAPANDVDDLRAGAEQVYAFYKSFPSAKQFAQAIEPRSDAPPDRFVDVELVSDAATSRSESANQQESAAPRTS